MLERYAATGLSAVRLHAEITAQGYHGSVHLVRRFVAALAEQKRHAARATVRYETGPGEQAQVDWKHVGRFTDAAGRPVAISAFVMVLSFSLASTAVKDYRGPKQGQLWREIGSRQVVEVFRNRASGEYYLPSR